MKKSNPEREARRAKFKIIARRIADMSEQERSSLATKHGVFNIEGRPLSVYNTCLLFCQFDGVSVVGGFRQWLAAGRAVRKGEHGLMLWFPCSRKAKDNEEQARPGFAVGTVFDISQTDEVKEHEHEIEVRAEVYQQEHQYELAIA